MAYATVDDLVARFGARELIQLTDRATPRTDEIDATVAQPALDGASLTIDAHVSVKYALPLTVTSLLLTDLCCDIARYRLYTSQAPEAVVDRHKAAIASLEKIAKGVMKLDVAAIEPDSRPATVIATSNERRATRCSLRDA